MARSAILTNFPRRPSETQMSKFLHENQQQGIRCCPGERVPHTANLYEAPDLENTKDLTDAFKDGAYFNLKSICDQNLLRPWVQTYLHVQPARRKLV
ncbi:MAG: hypothetical protein HOA17_00595 [Candidatus Melainabacteria bacterium]|jgi:hypothetical protein|nr:hypothetical protein [Candidatus Melainabacteria bacterium]